MSKITAEQLNAVYNFSNEINIPLSEVIKFTENYFNKKAAQEEVQEKRVKRYAEKIINEAFSEAHTGNYDEIFNNAMPRAILDGYTEYRELEDW